MSNILGLEKSLVIYRSIGIIGGIATKTVLFEKGLMSRETKDFDMVVLADASNKDFAYGIASLF